MPEQEPTPQHTPAQLAAESRRALASTMLTGATRLGPPAAGTLIDAADRAVWAILGGVGCSPLAARIIADVLWRHDLGGGRWDDVPERQR